MQWKLNCFPDIAILALHLASDLLSFYLLLFRMRNAEQRKNQQN